jgi:membrane protein required for colicin V production
VNALDIVVLALLALAALRGAMNGLVREVFSLLALAAAIVAARALADPVGQELHAWTGLGATPARLAGGLAAGVGALLAVGLAGRLLRRGVRAAGLGLADRAGGGVIGAAEGAVVACLLLLAVIAALGRDDPHLADSKSLKAFETLEAWAERGAPGLPDVASRAKE